MRFASICIFGYISLILLFFFDHIKADLSCPIKFGYFPDPVDCQGYYICTFGSAKLRKCSGSLQYQHTKQICDTATKECQQEGGQANRPTYSGLNMKSDSGSAAAAPASNVDQAPIAVTQPLPPPPTMAPEVSNAQSPRWQPMATPDSQQDAASSQSQLQPSAQSRRPYDFFHAPTTLPPAAEDKPQPARVIVKPFRDPTLSNNFMNQRPSFRPIVGRLTTPSAAAPPIQMANSGQNDREQHQRFPDQLSKGPMPPAFRASVPVKKMLAKPDNAFQPQNDQSDQQQSNNFPQPQTYAAADEGQPNSQDEEWQPPKTSAKYSAGWQGQASVPSDSWPAAPPLQTGQTFGNQPPQPDQNMSPYPAMEGTSARQRPQQPNMVPFMKAASQANSELPGNSDVPKEFQDTGMYKSPGGRKPPVIPTDSAMSQCTPEKCQLPKCFCGGTTIPGGLSIQDTPQMILLSFDAEINERNLPIYEQIFNKNRKNPNGCNIKATFFVSHEFTNYGMVRYLYEKGHEIGSHSITHGVGNGFKDEQAWETEMSGQKGFLASFAAIRPEDVKGARAPLLGKKFYPPVKKHFIMKALSGPGGDDQFQALYNGGFLYDSTLVTPTSSKAPFWPYTLDFAMPHVCVTPPCPQRGYRGLWELPLNPITGLYGENCYAFDRCTYGSTVSDVYKLLYSNFYDHYYSLNKAPFHLALHADWLKYPPHREAFEKFLDVVGTMKDTWVITLGQAVSWMQQPTPVSQLNDFTPWQCSADDAALLPKCDTINACPLEFRNRLRYFYTCSACPAEFPWKPEI